MTDGWVNLGDRHRRLHSAADERLIRRAHAVAKSTTVIAAELGAKLHVIRDNLAGHPAAASYEQDRVAGHTTVVDDQGVPMPGTVDPTGEAAIHPDRAAADHAELVRHVATLERHATTVADLLARYDARTPTDKERREAERANKPCCASHARIRNEVTGGPQWEDPCTKKPTDAAGNLAQPMWLCTWCRRQVLETGRLPTVAEVADYHAGKPVRRGVLDK